MNKKQLQRRKRDNAKALAPTVKDRACGGCTACCTALGVPAIDKPPRTPCPHTCGGCAIYPTRPTDCQTYKCLWLMGAFPQDEARPDKLGIVFDTATNHVVGTFVIAREMVPGAVDGELAQLILNGISQQCVVYIQLTNGRRRILTTSQEQADAVMDFLKVHHLPPPG
jgi:hypothetical protein